MAARMVCGVHGAGRSAAVSQPPDAVEVYRGQSAGAPVGLSWTLEAPVAAHFARGHRGFRNPEPVILRATVRRADVALVLTSRQEAEIVLFKPPQRRAVAEMALTEADQTTN